MESILGVLRGFIGALSGFFRGYRVSRLLKIQHSADKGP